MLPEGTAPHAGDDFSFVGARAVCACPCERKLFCQTRCGRCLAFARPAKSVFDMPATKLSGSERLIAYRAQLSSEGGILRTESEGEVLMPFEHQRSFVERALRDNVEVTVLSHSMGLGKTVSALQLVAALGRRRGFAALKVVISVPSSCLVQWKETIFRWLSLAKREVLVTNKTEALPRSQRAFERIKILVVTHSLVSHLYSTTRKHAQGKETPEGAVERANLVFGAQFSVLLLDEAHVCRTPKTLVCVAHRALSERCLKRIPITGTVIHNGLLDALGLCIAVKADPRLQDRDFWFNRAGSNAVNPEALRLFKSITDSQTNRILKLPPLLVRSHDFLAELPPAAVKFYNSVLGNARALDCSSSVSPEDAEGDPQRQMLTSLQQCLASPLLAELGAEEFNKRPELYKKAAKEGSGALRAVAKWLERLIAAPGEPKVIFAAQHTSLIKLVHRYLELNHPQMATFFWFTGAFSPEDRDVQKKRFLAHEGPAICGLSIKAGAFGVDLSGVQKILCALSCPWNPATEEQLAARCHRIGQTKPVEVHYLRAHGSVCAAISELNKEKSAVAKAVNDGELGSLELNVSSLAESQNTGSILKNCRALGADGNFEGAARKRPRQGGAKQA